MKIAGVVNSLAKSTISSRRVRPTTLADLLWDAATVAGDHPAIAISGQITTYADLRGQASSVAAALVDRGVKSGDPWFANPAPACCSLHV